MIRVVVIDDHPALRAGLKAVLDAEPGLVYAGECDGEEERVWPMLNRLRPDVVLVDYHLPRGDGLQLCYRIKHQVPAPGIIVYTAYASPTLALPARLAQADALVAKGAGARELFDAIKLVSRGERLVPPVSRASLEECADRLTADDQALVGMLLDDATEPEIAETLRLSKADVRHAVQRVISALRIEVPAARLP